jgi:hypothetical protein
MAMQPPSSSYNLILNNSSNLNALLSFNYNIGNWKEQ